MLTPLFAAVLLAAQSAPEVEPDRVIAKTDMQAEWFTFASDGKSLLTMDSDLVRVWDILSGKEAGYFPNGWGVLTLFPQLTQDGKTLIGASRRGSGKGVNRVVLTRVMVWDVEPRRQRFSFDLPPLPFGRWWTVRISPDGQRLLAYNWPEQEMLLYDLTERKRIKALPAPKADLPPHWPALFSPDSKVLATGDAQGGVRLWDGKTGKELGVLAAHIDVVRAFAFSPNGATLASAGNDRTIYLWDVARREKRAELRADKMEQFVALAFSPDGTALAALGKREEFPGLPNFTGRLALWDLRPAPRQRQYASPELNPTGDSTIAFSPDGKHLVTCEGRSKGVQFWSLTGSTLK